MWDVAAELDDDAVAAIVSDTTWRVAQVRLEFGPAPTIGALLASLGDVLACSRLMAVRPRVLETPEGRFMSTYCDLLHHDGSVVDALSPLLGSEAIGLT